MRVYSSHKDIISTLFSLIFSGYEVVSYPLTDQFPFESFEGAFSRQQTNLSENVIQENEEQDTTATDRTDETAQNKCTTLGDNVGVMDKLL